MQNPNTNEIITLYYEAAALAHELVKRTYDRRRKDVYRNRCGHLRIKAMLRLERRTAKYMHYVQTI